MKVLVLLGTEDHPTDGVADYSRLLARALLQRGIDASVKRVDWQSRGWLRALRDLHPVSEGVVLLQYTHLAWSRRGFPLGAIIVFKALNRGGARVGVVFHDPMPFGGSRWRDRFRRRVQRWVVRAIARRAQPSFTTLEPEVAPVFRGIDPRPTFLPAGSNVPSEAGQASNEGGFVVSVFCISEHEPQGALEISEIAEIASRVADRMPNVRLQVFGRGVMAGADLLRSSIRAIPLTLEGVIDASAVADRLAVSNVLLFVRGEASSRRSTIVAAICNGVPVVAAEGPETGPTIRSAGIRLYPRGDTQAAANELTRVSDPVVAAKERFRQRRACERTFSWEAIATRLQETL